MLTHRGALVVVGACEGGGAAADFPQETLSVLILEPRDGAGVANEYSGAWHSDLDDDDGTAISAGLCAGHSFW